MKRLLALRPIGVACITVLCSASRRGQDTWTWFRAPSTCVYWQITAAIFNCSHGCRCIFAPSSRDRDASDCGVLRFERSDFSPGRAAARAASSTAFIAVR